MLERGLLILLRIHGVENGAHTLLQDEVGEGFVGRCLLLEQPLQALLALLLNVLLVTLEELEVDADDLRLDLDEVKVEARVEVWRIEASLERLVSRRSLRWRRLLVLG